MKTIKILRTTLAMLVTTTAIHAQVPAMLNHQGLVSVGGTNFTGTGQFQFSLVDTAGATTYWSNGASIVSLPVSQGLYSVQLGDTNVANMAALPASVFTNSDVRLRISFSTSGSPQQLTPDQQIVAVGYALMAQTVADGSITSNKLAAGNFNVNGTITANAFVGDGSGLTNVTAGGSSSIDVIGLRLNVGTNNTLSGYYATIAGGQYNTSSSTNATVGGGTYNTASASYATVAGGIGNIASNQYATVAGGNNNAAGGYWDTVGGGANNKAISGSAATVAGGYNNQAIASYAAVVGGQGNIASAQEAFIGGGGNNTASGSMTFIGGGRNNLASSSFATVGGGYTNTAKNTYATISGGMSNTASGVGAFVGGGGYDGVFSPSGNVASGGGSAIVGGWGNATAGTDAFIGGGVNNKASSAFDAVGGGSGNTASGGYATVGGGQVNNASGYAATVAGGLGNTASTGGYYDTVGGGQMNNASGGYAATVAGGAYNTASASYATVAGGDTNIASSTYAMVGGGHHNTASGTRATVGGGAANTASGNAATVPGGIGNTASGDYSFAAGTYAQAIHLGAFVWGDETASSISSTVSNQFTVRASGGVRFFTDSGATLGAQLASDATAWTTLSDRNAKENIEPIDAQEILAQLIQMPVTKWNYKADPSQRRYIGPMAQDFYNAFGLGDDDKRINTLDTDGVTLAAIQGLYQTMQEKDARIDALEKRVADLEQLIGQLTRPEGK